MREENLIQPNSNARLQQGRHVVTQGSLGDGGVLCFAPMRMFPEGRDFLHREGGTFRETETRNAICLAFLNACDSAVTPLDDLAQLAELDLNGQRRDR